LAALLMLLGVQGCTNSDSLNETAFEVQILWETTNPSPTNWDCVLVEDARDIALRPLDPDSADTLQGNQIRWLDETSALLQNFVGGDCTGLGFAENEIPTILLPAGAYDIERLNLGVFEFWEDATSTNYVCFDNLELPDPAIGDVILEVGSDKPNLVRITIDITEAETQASNFFCPDVAAFIDIRTQ